VTELRFHRDLYKGAAVDAAAKVYQDYVGIELIEEDSHWVVRLTSDDPERERLVAGELGNYALGATVDGRGGPR
jgi:hypothetical protein